MQLRSLTFKMLSGALIYEELNKLANMEFVISYFSYFQQLPWQAGMCSINLNTDLTYGSKESLLATCRQLLLEDSAWHVI